MYHSIRLSRLTHPRVSLIAIMLLIVVFGIFGAVVSAIHPESAAAVSESAPDTLQEAAMIVSNWIFCA